MTKYSSAGSSALYRYLKSSITSKSIQKSETSDRRVPTVLRRYYPSEEILTFTVQHLNSYRSFSHR